MVILISNSVNAKINRHHYHFGPRGVDTKKISGLNGFVARFGKKHINRIYAAKVKDDDGKRSWYGYWKEDNSILLLEHFADCSSLDSYYWLHHKARVDLKTDVVPTKEDISGSTFLVDKPWVDRIVQTCLTKGRKITIYKPGRLRKSVDPRSNRSSLRNSGC